MHPLVTAAMSTAPRITTEELKHLRIDEVMGLTKNSRSLFAILLSTGNDAQIAVLIPAKDEAAYRYVAKDFRNLGATPCNECGASCTPYRLNEFLENSTNVVIYLRNMRQSGIIIMNGGVLGIVPLYPVQPREIYRYEEDLISPFTD